MARFIIRGGNTLKGTHTAAGNKNAALPMLAACVLTDEPVTLKNLPLIEDVRTMLAILDDLGVQVDLRGHTVRLCARGLRRTRLNADLCRAVRTSILFAGPLAARLGRATLAPPGGDVIGRRRIDTHVYGLAQLGIRAAAGNSYDFRRRRLAGTDILLDEASVTATENIVMAAVLARGQTTLFNAACEPHVQDLCTMLNAMGARISGIGTNRLAIQGVPTLHGVTHEVGPDTIELASYIAATAITGGELCVCHPPVTHLPVIERAFGRLGIGWTFVHGRLQVPPQQAFTVDNDVAGAIPKIEDGPWPSFPSDLMSVAIVLATQARGTVLFFEKMFESRMYFVDRLIDMGARIIQCDPHRVVVSGPARLHGMHLSSPDIRAGMAMILAALCAKGETEIDNAQVIDRGYEQVEVNLRKLGAAIERVE